MQNPHWRQPLQGKQAAAPTSFLGLNGQQVMGGGVHIWLSIVTLDAFSIESFSPANAAHRRQLLGPAQSQSFSRLFRMAKPKVLVLRAPGTNCDVETAYAFEIVGGEPQSIHINQLIENPEIADDFQILCFPGGFSYGDDIAAGRILAQRLNVHLGDVVESFRSGDKLVLGICNGFQVMMRLGIFFAPDEQSAPATLTWNNQARFEDRWVHLVNANSNSVFLQGIEKVFLPMAHAEGRFVFRDEAAKSAMQSAGQLGLRYATEDGGAVDETLAFPINPNGAELNVAGISDATGRIFGLMPHPERHLEPTHHPFWTRRKEQPEFGEGRKLFQNAVDYFN